MNETEFYVLRHEGKYFRSTGYGGIGERWVPLNRAKTYSKRPAALAQALWWVERAGITPELVCLHAVEKTAEDLRQYFVERQAKREAAIKRALVREAKRDLEEAQRRYSKVARAA